MKNCLFGTSIIKRIFAASICFILAGLSFKCHAQQPEETIFYNGKIFTANIKKPFAEAVAIRGDKIVSVGREKKVFKNAGENALKVDLKGQTLAPGFADSHIHAIGGGLSLISAHLGDKYISDDSLKIFAEKSRKNGTALYADVMMITGLNMQHWESPDVFSKLFNTGVYDTIPLYLRSADGHTGWLNKAMLLKEGINKEFINLLPPDVKKLYGLNSEQSPNGIINEKPVFELYSSIQSRADEKNFHAGITAMRYLNSQGFTALLDPRYQDPSPVYKALADKGELTAHVAVCIRVDPDEEPLKQIEYVESLRKKYENTPGLSISGIKIFADGVAEFPAQTAALSKPYLNTGLNGDLLFKPDKFLALAVAAEKSGMSIQVHAIGDKTTTSVLDVFEELRKINGKQKITHTMIHLQFVNPEDYKRFKQLGIAASFSFLWAHADTVYTKLIEPYIDPEIYNWQYPINSMRKSGALIAAGSDWPVSPPDPFEAIYVGETRRNETDLVLNKKERMPRQALLYAYTINAAKAMNMEKEIGSIEVGKQADLILIDRDIISVSAEELKSAKIIWTMLGGKKVYEAKQ